MIVNGFLTLTFKQYNWIYCRLNARMASLLVPPESVRRMTCLDRTAFTTTVGLPYLKFDDQRFLKLIPTLKKYFVKIRNFKPMQSANNETTIYLNPTAIKCFDDFTDSEKKELLGTYKSFGITNITLNYDNWRSYDLLRAILPQEVDVPTSYSIIGHILHLNLRDAHLPYKTIIGQIYLDTTSCARTIVNKTNTIDSTFRNFTMEILAGDKDTITVAKENGYTYHLDFSHVYWNPRLSTEHKTVVALMKPNDILYDVFAGIGPFAIPAARKRIKVFANDLNPECYKWLQKNTIANKVEKNVKLFNIDGREFLRTVFKDDILNRRANNEVGVEHIVMNLPALAIEFLDVFFDSFNEHEIKQMCLRPPIVHLYCFVKAGREEDSCKLGQLLVEEKFGCMLDSTCLVDTHCVRNVSVNKEMIRISFLLNKNVLRGEEPAMKKLKIENNFNISETDHIAEHNGKEQRITEETKEQKCV